MKFQALIGPAPTHLKIMPCEFRIAAGDAIFATVAIHIAVCGYGAQTARSLNPPNRPTETIEPRSIIQLLEKCFWYKAIT